MRMIIKYDQYDNIYDIMINILSLTIQTRIKGQYKNLVGKNAENNEHGKKNDRDRVASNIVQSANNISGL